MSSEQDNTAIVAIIIALIAFFVTTAQLLQAILGTAEGFRRCQPSVIGGWYAETRRRWRWSEFRFETRFKTPHITLDPVTDATIPESPSRARRVFLTGEVDSRQKTYAAGKTPPSQRRPRFFQWFLNVQGDEDNNDLASWLELVDRLHERVQLYWRPEVQGKNLINGQTLRKQSTLSSSNMFSHDPNMAYACTVTLPAVTFRTRSWDFMPPDIIRPVASSTVGNIIALAHRLGMAFKELAPGEGTMRAEGNGHTIVSTSVRGFGILLQYTNDQAVTKKDETAWRSLTIPSAEADKLGFRIIPGYERFDIPDFDFGDSNDLESIKRAIDQLGLSKVVKGMYSDYFKRSSRFFGFSDLIAIASPFMPLRHSSVIRIYRPHRDIHDSPLTWYEGFAIFRSRLSELQKGHPEEMSEAMRRVLQIIEYMNRQYSTDDGPPCWEEETWNVGLANGRSIAFLEKLRRIWTETDAYFSRLEREYSSLNTGWGIFRYRDLMAAHISQALYYPNLSAKTIAEGDEKYAKDNNFRRRYDLGRGRSPRMAEAMHLYIDRVPKVQQFMCEKGFSNMDIVRDAWWMLMLRAMCWHRSVSFSKDIPTSLVPSSLYGSSIPVYIA